MREYEKYNRYHKVNNTINTLILQGLVEGGFYEDCLLLFVSLVINVRFDINRGFITKHGISSTLDWNSLIKESVCGFGIVDEKATYFDKETKQKLFSLTAKSSSSPNDLQAQEMDVDEEVNIKFHKTNVLGHYITMNKRSYEHCIKAACELNCIEYADLLYTILVTNRIKPRKNSLFSILNVGEVGGIDT